ncbi:MULTISPECIES: undecaprenyldiphospho-muramoylpentapeptide beta-N-acetylglucosaminyltransferase [Arthrobacter]|uniref:UDP-N-acetylglucosamine--N-acetylmuramyl-(pentapeptide) pyrophosphoryl-undecaprenol N-acetylglucosamine transferase n=1 Tax=Arthrobacter psychrochitiniphilus TaxID=291045 RepID=A0A2V3DTF1_9MICC|nr:MULTISPECIES: undecaprenyldiphospho-muramoylpentapeptide beta-N-acetylglucosaminyltransferase [Arthrobacter]NYG17301.1 UDP-N-acetylglucosamine--N-acetylmuramyl-(pentapeptide) pyrophosphoryl-undecaprenol N-acetylglucosamine transferase [Arthrobacter psychrochitiniphilus]PXA65433.1 undecaprenyldiphospho-muramoylpentapeptide beta-N-acetylglucosaminyltransferase [Arthrobacter psychrochitiniphilus]
MTENHTTALSVVLAGGGSAGHVSPLLAIAAAIRAKAPETAILAVGTKEGLETTLVPAAGFELTFVERIPLPRKPSMDLVKLPGRMLRAIRDAKTILNDAQADVLVGVGGYVCTPMYLAAKSLGVPIVIHEANTKAGLANKVGARYTTHVGTAFAETAIRHAHLVGMPMRKEIASLTRHAGQAAATSRLGLAVGKPTLIVTGGSLGALRLNQAIAASLQALADAGIQTLHITGKGKTVLGDDGAALAAPGYQQVEYVDSMEDVYAAADLLLCRSGAGTVSEVAAVGLPAVFVPLPIGNGEQARNAAGLVAAGAALLVPDGDVDAAWVSAELIPLCLDAPRLARMAANASELGIRDAAESMAAMVFAASGK